MNRHKPLVLILCTGNSCRSQMAEAFLRVHHGHEFEVASAGTLPRPEVHPLAVRVMAERGIDISAQKPRAIESFLGRAPVRHLLIVCDRAHGSCPRIWPGTLTREFMPFDDPAEAVGDEEEILTVFRRVRDEIEMAMREWKPDPKHLPAITT